MNVLNKYEILELLKEYQTKGALADDTFIKKAIYIILNGYTSTIEGVNIGKHAYLFDKPFYEADTKIIYFKNDFDINDITKGYFKNELDMIAIYNLYVLRKIYEVCLDILKHTFRSEGFLQELYDMESEFKSIDINPTERIIEIDALKKVNEIAGWMSFYDKTTFLNYFIYETTKALLRGYTGEYFTNSPVYQYRLQYVEYLKQNRRYFPCDCDITQDLKRTIAKHTEEENIYYGLPISSHTYNFVLFEQKHAYSILTRKRN